MLRRFQRAVRRDERGLIAGARRVSCAWLLVLAGLVSCGGAPESSRAVLERLAKSFIPKDARGLADVPQLPWVQIDFVVDRLEGDFSIDEANIARAAADGWHVCRPKSKEWNEFDDATITPPRRVRARGYVLHRPDALIVLTATRDVERPTHPDSALGGSSLRREVHGTIVAKPFNLAELQPTTDALDVSC